jgi:hypothetical protein
MFAAMKEKYKLDINLAEYPDGISTVVRLPPD